MKNIEDYAKIKNIKNGLIQFFDTRAEANAFCTKHREWILVL